MRWNLELEGGGRVPLRRGVTLIGRSAACDIVLSDPSISRRQLLLSARPTGVEVFNLGRQPLSSDGHPVVDGTLLGDGSRLCVGGLPMAVIRGAREAGSRWLLRIDDGPRLNLRGAPFTIGGEADDLTLPEWPDGALTIHSTDSGLIFEASQTLLEALGSSERPHFDDDGFARTPTSDAGQIHCLGVRFTVELRSRSSPERTTVCAAAATLVQLERYAKGGVLTIEGEDAPTSVFLAARRFALMSNLMSPRSPAAPGDFVSVQNLCAAIWPEDPLKDETDFNVLLYRVRRDLLRAEFDLSALIERARGSGMIRSPIAARAKITLC